MLGVAGVLRLLQQQQAARRQVQRHAEDVLQRCSSYMMIAAGASPACSSGATRCRSSSVSLYGVTAGLLGGTGVWAMRTVHYILNWLFIIMTTVHLYLAATADMPCALDFFGIKEMERLPGRWHHGDAPTTCPHAESQPEPQTA